MFLCSSVVVAEEIVTLIPFLRGSEHWSKLRDHKAISKVGSFHYCEHNWLSFLFSLSSRPKVAELSKDGQHTHTIWRKEDWNSIYLGKIFSDALVVIVPEDVQHFFSCAYIIDAWHRRERLVRLQIWRILMAIFASILHKINIDILSRVKRPKGKLREAPFFGSLGSQNLNNFKYEYLMNEWIIF